MGNFLLFFTENHFRETCLFFLTVVAPASSCSVGSRAALYYTASIWKKAPTHGLILPIKMEFYLGLNWY